MQMISLSRGLVTLVDDEDFEVLSHHNWTALRARGTFYAHRSKRINGRPTYISMHRTIMGAPDGVKVDHWDGDGLNNQRFNLRFATSSQNQANQVRLPANTSGRRGVSWHRQLSRWQARIVKDGRHFYLGLFTDLDDAARAYDVAARKLFGEFARLNFPEDGEQSSMPGSMGQTAQSQVLLISPQSFDSRLRENNTSGYRGVCWDKSRNRWMASIGKDNKQISLGRFVDIEAAARAYDAAARRLFGRVALTNFEASS